MSSNIAISVQKDNDKFIIRSELFSFNLTMFDAEKLMLKMMSHRDITLAVEKRNITHTFVFKNSKMHYVEKIRVGKYSAYNIYKINSDDFLRQLLQYIV